MKVWINGEFKPAEEATIPLLSFSLARGLTIFEVLSCHPSDKGPACLCLDQHMDRFFNSAKLLHMKLPYTKEELNRAVLATGRENGVKEIATAKWFAYIPGISLGALPVDDSVEVAIVFDEYSAFGFDQAKLSAPVASGISSYRKCDPRSVPIKAKVVGNYVNGYLSKMEAISKGWGDSILMGCDDFVAEGPTNNTFFVQDGKVMTPPLDRILTGTTRGFVIDVIRDMGLELVEAPISLEDLENVEEAFSTSCLVKIQPIKSLNDRPLGQACPGPVTAKIIDRVWSFLGSPSGELEKKYISYL